MRIQVQYDGTAYNGWQIQSSGRTIQGELTRVLSVLDHRPVVVHGAGRTDSGVHATGQVASFMIERDFDPARLRDAINGNLERDIRVTDASFVDDSFHARKLARQKTYVYRFWTSEVVSPFWFRYVDHRRGQFNVDRMQSAADFLIGVHDFSAFTAADCEGASRVRTLTELVIERRREILSIRISGDGFLRYMVRTIAGTLIEVGAGKRRAEEIAQIVASRERARAGATAPACGLTLARVDY